MCFSATELGNTTSMTVDTLEQFSCNVNLSPTANAKPLITIPVVQGMGFVTAVYYGATPCVQSSVFFRKFTPAGSINGGVTEKYKVILEDNSTWLIYRTFANQDGANQSSPLIMASNSTLKGNPGFSGYIQVAKLRDPSFESVYDSSAGAYTVSGNITAIASGTGGRYSFNWTKQGLPKPVLMFALPHHVESFAAQTSASITPIRMRAITKGTMSGVLADLWVLEEKLPTDLGFAPYSLTKGSVTAISDSVKTFINSIAAQEIQQDVKAQCCLNSMYFSGKGLAKFAMIAYVLHDMTGAPDLSAQCLAKLKDAFTVFVNNQQQCPLVYEQGWKGAVSTAGLNGDPGQDFGNSYYNDHHFHYGYFVYTAAVIGYLDPSWLNDSKNKSWVNMLVRDFANPGYDDYFPFSRSFDWFAGHSWVSSIDLYPESSNIVQAKGLFASGDGKDQESTSEDMFASYGLKMWGNITGNKSLEASGDLRLAIQRRVFHDYFLMQSDNKIQPANFIGNKVTGILFENKIDHATYFSGNIECIQGIHILPVTSPSALIRSPQFGMYFCTHH
jgi:endo-1,3(4)-beta-glucanase